MCQHYSEVSRLFGVTDVLLVFLVIALQGFGATAYPTSALLRAHSIANSTQPGADYPGCNYLCKSQCSSGAQTAVCKNCMYNCHSEKSCEGVADQEKCLINRACGIHAYNKHTARGATVNEPEPWLFCQKHSIDQHCTTCLKCVQEKCYHAPGAYHTQCSGPYGECCRRQCFGTYFLLSNIRMNLRNHS